MSDVLLEAKGITMQFGGLKAVDNLSFKIEKGQLAGLIGPNGAGKTTAFNMLTGVYQPTHGEVFLDGQSLTGLRPYQISQRGIARTFQNIRLFKNLTVLENVLIATHQHVSYGIMDALFQTKKFVETEKQMTEKAMDLLSLFSMQNKADELASSLPYGQQRKLEIVRALATDPKIILLDEPAAGMNHSETHQLMETIAQIRSKFNLTVLLIEHDMKLVMGICENIVVLDHGVKIEEGTPKHVQNSKKVIEAYLGVEETH
ncbi:ABC transporter ATP-binding protein [Bdellovibrio sp. HCB288]|uniref:ABC transporter ATP-binding protein n=1 Tax=Bdellovibrio sp. HCB288 TaxID=3394355 RepID=UPI0039B5E998